MLYLLLGPDDFSKREYVNALAKSAGIEAEFFVGEENTPQAQQFLGQDLFSKSKIFVLKNLIAHYNQPEIINKFIADKNQIIIIEEKLDKRLADNKKLLANKEVKIQEFNLPHGRELDAWIVKRVEFHKGEILPDAAEALAMALGRDNAKETKFGGKVVEVQEVYNLWQAESEIRKLISFSANRQISETHIKQLISESQEVDVFELTNAIADGKKQQALELMHKFFIASAGTEEKGSVIQLNALLSEQFRNVAMVQDFLVHKKSEDQILDVTGWKSGRLFVMKKIAAKFPSKKIIDCLNKLEALDEELKSSSIPPKVLLDLILVQLF